MSGFEFTIVELKQGTRERLEWRHQGIGASDAPTIMGENPWKTAPELLHEKCGPVRQSVQSEAMARGGAKRCQKPLFMRPVATRGGTIMVPDTFPPFWL